MSKSWSKEDLKFLKENYSKLGAIKCSQILNRSQHAIITKAFRLGISFYERPIDPNLKQCGHCREIKTLNEFGKGNKYRGTTCWCKKCQKESRDKRKDKIRLAGIIYRGKNKEKLIQKRKNKLQNLYKDIDALKRDRIAKIIYGAKHRSKLKGWKFDLDLEWALNIVPEKCPIFNFQLTYDAGFCSMTSPSLDRIDNSRGYIKDNCIFISRKANTIKNCATIEELTKIADFYKELQIKRAVS